MTWLVGAGWGWIASLGLWAGAAAGMYGRLEHRGIARAMALGAGVLLAVLSLDLLAAATREGGAVRVTAAFALGAVAFSLANAWLARRGARDRKRCGGCVEQPSEQSSPGSGLAIVFGTMLDALPESVIIGLETTARGGGLGWAVVAAFALGNFPEALSSAAGMTAARRSARYIWAVWIAASALSAATAGASAAFLPAASAEALAHLKAFAAGALLAMTVETLIPEAAHGAGAFTGTLAAGGFIVLMLFLALAA